MHVVEVFLPLRDGQGTPFPRAALDRVRRELTERYGGVTAHLRAPAAGAWKDEEGDVERDDVVIVEVVVDELDRGWWAGYRRELEERFRQDEVLVRATACERL
ncbi:MAG TPA: hypothetical protein VHG08_18765 [Longimicrobium sp.]|nr:hypothetical protein [Longimicrobium sp.]